VTKHNPSELLPLVYDELRSLAARYLRQERPNHTLQPTALVHEAYVALARKRGVEWHGKTHFLATAASQMRRVLVDYARQRNALKRGGHVQMVSLEEHDAITPDGVLDILAIDQALERLEQLNVRQKDVVEMRLFAGLTEIEIAGLLGVSERTVREDWRIARAWLTHELAL
jgi:RNA polymerase sigma-70 factor (ECF subfamily)